MARRQVHFLGWDSVPIPRIAAWLREHCGGDLHEWLIAVPGGRALRTLRRALASEPGGAAMPELVTGGALTDRLLVLEGEPASRLTRTLCWEQVLRASAVRDITRLAGDPSVQSEAGRIRGLAEQLRQTHAELVGAGLRMDDVVRCPVLAERPLERERWEAFGRVQAAYRALLSEHGLIDPHDRRRAALQQGSIRNGAKVVLVDLAEHQALRTDVLEALEGEVHHLVLAPLEAEALFDEAGCLDHQAWLERPLDLPLERWRVVADSHAQAEEAIRALSEVELDGQAAVGLGDPAALPSLREAFARHGIELRDAAGAPLLATPELRLLRLLIAALRDPNSRSFSDLWRHPWFEQRLSRELEGEAVPIGDLDGYLREHLVTELGDALLGKSQRTAQRNARLQAAFSATERLLGGLLRAQERVQSLAALRALFIEVAPQPELDLDAPEHHERVQVLRTLGGILAELEALPAGIHSGSSGWEHLDRVLQAAEGLRVPPAPLATNEPTVEALGWLELVHDSADHLVVTSTLEGCIPAAPRIDSLLPSTLRSQLGLSTDEHRLARDLHLAQVLHRSRTTTWISPRLAPSGDPSLPSRLLLRSPQSELAGRVRHWTRGGARVASASPLRPTIGLPSRLLRTKPRSVFAVTSFKRWMEAPFLFHVRDELRLRTCTDFERELDPAGFGTLLHSALEVLQERDLASCEDEGVLLTALEDSLSDAARARLGPSPRPAIALQIEQARMRLARFAGEQAKRVRQGWRVSAIEWKPADPVPLPGTDVAIMGSIDRIDEHEDGRLCLIDYKTASQAKAPQAAHLKGEVWKDLQLPLYLLLAQELIGDRHAHAAYANLGKDEGETGFRDWDDVASHTESALARAVEIVEEIHSGALGAADPRFRPFEAFEGYLVGRGLDLDLDTEGGDA